MFEAVLKSSGRVIVISLIGDLNSKSDLDEKIVQAVNEKPDAIALNCKNLKNIDSTGLGTLIGILKKLKDASIEMAICDINSDINSIFDITKLNHYFKVTTLEEFKGEFGG